jgi:hypothetical protein
MTVNAFVIQYAQEARSYSLVLLATVLSSYLFVRAVDDSTLRRWLEYSAVSILAVYAHPFALLILVGHLASLAFFHPRPAWKHLGVGYGAIAILVAPLMVLILIGDPLHRSFASGPSLGAVKSLFLNLTGGAGVPGGIVLLLAYFGACSVALIRISSNFRRDSRRSWQHAFVFCWLSVPLVVSLATSMVRPNLVPRYLIVVLPALLLLTSLGVTYLGARVAIGVTVAFVTLGIYSLAHYYSADYKNGENWRAAVASVAARAQHGDGIIFFSHLGRQPFEYYLASYERARRELVPLYPGDRWSDYLPVLSETRLESTQEAAAELESFSRVWTVLLWFPNNHDDVRPIERILSREFVETDHKDFGTEMQIRLSERRPSRRNP